MDKPIVNEHYQIKKQPGKGGWSYVEISGIQKEKTASGLVRVRGLVDSYELRQFNLLPLKNGNMLLPLKAALRRAIKKEEGDIVHVCLFIDKSAVDIPQEILDSLMESQNAYDFFLTLSDSNKKYYIDWVEDAKKIETKVDRIVKMILLLEKKKKFWDWPVLSEI